MTEAGGTGLSRREMIGATAAALATPWLGIGPVVGPATRLQAPRFLTAAEYALLDELTERIIPTDEQSPGARAAGVAAYIDVRLSESPEPEWQATWRSGLRSVDDLSRELHGKPFLEGTPDQRGAVLTQMAAGESNPQTRPQRFFGELKGWTVRAYYSSRIGIHTDQEYKGNVYQPGDYAGFDAT
jgi:hypothetical protein